MVQKVVFQVRLTSAFGARIGEKAPLEQLDLQVGIHRGVYALPDHRRSRRSARGARHRLIVASTHVQVTGRTGRASRARSEEFSEDQSHVGHQGISVDRRSPQTSMSHLIPASLDPPRSLESFRGEQANRSGLCEPITGVGL